MIGHSSTVSRRSGGRGRFCEPLSIAAALVLLALGVASSGCSSVSAKGIVRTVEGEPVAGATLTLRSSQSGVPEPARYSEPNGCFNVFGMARGQEAGVLLVESPGYKPLEWHIPPGRDSLLLITLAPASAANASSARPVTPRERGTLYATPCEPQIRANSLSLH
jgi:hypothetical protein